MSNPAVEGILNEIVGSVARLPDAAVRDLLPILQEAERELRRDLRIWDAAHSDRSLAFTRARYRSLLVQLRTSVVSGQKRIGLRPHWVDKVQGGLRSVLLSHHEKGKALSGKNLARELNEIPIAMDMFPAPIDIEKVLSMASGDRMLVPRFESSARRYAGEMWRDIRYQFAVGVARKETIEELTDRIRKLGGPSAPDAPGGIFRRHRYKAERLVRTEVINAYNVEHDLSIKEVAAIDPEVMSRWDARLDLRVCPICKGLHEETVSPGAPFDGGYVHPPAHPHCRCCLIAWLPGISE